MDLTTKKKEFIHVLGKIAKWPTADHAGSDADSLEEIEQLLFSLSWVPRKCIFSREELRQIAEAVNELPPERWITFAISCIIGSEIIIDSPGQCDVLSHIIAGNCGTSEPKSTFEKTACFSRDEQLWNKADKIFSTNNKLYGLVEHVRGQVNVRLREILIKMMVSHIYEPGMDLSFIAPFLTKDTFSVVSDLVSTGEVRMFPDVAEHAGCLTTIPVTRQGPADEEQDCRSFKFRKVASLKCDGYRRMPVFGQGHASSVPTQNKCFYTFTPDRIEAVRNSCIRTIIHNGIVDVPTNNHCCKKCRNYTVFFDFVKHRCESENLSRVLNFWNISESLMLQYVVDFVKSKYDGPKYDSLKDEKIFSFILKSMGSCALKKGIENGSLSPSTFVLILEKALALGTKDVFSVLTCALSSKMHFLNPVDVKRIALECLKYPHPDYTLASMVNAFPWLATTWFDVNGNGILHLCFTRYNVNKIVTRLLFDTCLPLKKNVNLENKNGLTPLLLSSEYLNRRIIDAFNALVLYGEANLHFVTRNNETIFHRIAMCNNIHVLQAVKKVGLVMDYEFPAPSAACLPRINLKREPDGATALTMAVARGFLLTAQLLLQMGASPLVRFGKTKTSITLVEAVTLKGLSETIKMLQKKTLCRPNIERIRENMDMLLQEEATLGGTGIVSHTPSTVFVGPDGILRSVWLGMCYSNLAQPFPKDLDNIGRYEHTLNVAAGMDSGNASCPLCDRVFMQHNRRIAKCCGHAMHNECWQTMNSSRCPMCNANMVPKENLKPAAMVAEKNKIKEEIVKDDRPVAMVEGVPANRPEMRMTQTIKTENPSIVGYEIYSTDSGDWVREEFF